MTQRAQSRRFWEIAVGREQLTVDEAHAYLLWWGDQVGRDLQLEHKGLPVPADVFEVVEQAGLVGFYAARAPSERVAQKEPVVTWLFKLEQPDQVHEALVIAAAAAREMPLEVGPWDVDGLRGRGEIEVMGRIEFVELVAKRLDASHIPFDVE